MSAPSRKVRKAFYVEPRLIKRAKRLLGLRSDADVVRKSVERLVEMEEFWCFMDKSKRTLAPGSFPKR